MRNINWEAVSAIGTILSAIVALGIAVFSYTQSVKREQKSNEKEAIEKIIVPIRKKLDGFLESKWDIWGRWDQLTYTKSKHTLQYLKLDSSIQNTLESFNQQFNRVVYLSQQMNDRFIKSVVSSFCMYINERGILYETTGGVMPDGGNIANAHWSCVVGGKYGPSATLFSLVMWDKTVSEYIEHRKSDIELPNTRVENFKFSMSNTEGELKIYLDKLDKAESDVLLLKINEDIKKDNDLDKYRQELRELYNSGSSLIKKIDLWLGTKSG